MKKLANMTTTLLLLWLTATVAAQSRTENSLLWRINGNGLKTTSYLFGTMHVYDKNAFNFKDSLYYFLEHSEGFALEFNPDSANSIMEEYWEGITKSHDEDEAPPEISPADLKSMQEKMKTGKKDIVKDDEKGMLNYFTDRLVANDKKQKNSMNTFMDAYLYEMAEQEGKKMYGLEPVSIELNARLALSRGLKVKKIVNLLHKWDPEEQSPITDYYYREDIDSMNYFFNTYFTEESVDNFLYKRNTGMVARMDSLMKVQSMFMAIGAGHLGGTKGVIALLRQQGYRLEPVFSSQKIFASDYKINKRDRPTFPVRDEQFGLEYELPGKPNTKQADAGRSVVYYYDLGAGLLYMTVCDKISKSDSKRSEDELAISKLDEMVSKVEGKKLSSKVISTQGLKGMEVVCLGSGNNYYRFYELISGKVYYLFSLTAQKKDNLFSPDAEKFIASFKRLPIPVPTWNPFEAPEDGFKVSFPGKPKIEPLKFKDATGVTALSYTFFDAASGINCTVVPSKIMTGAGYLNTKFYLDTYVKNLTETADQSKTAVADTMVEGFAARTFTIPALENKMKGFVIKRGNIIYLVAVEFEPGTTEGLVQKFLNSFSLIDFRKPNWALRGSPDGAFSSWVPADYDHEPVDSSALDNKTDIKIYHSIDPYSASDYTITAEPINKYFWAANEDSIYSFWESRTTGMSYDSILVQSTVKNGNRPGRERILFDKIDSLTKRSRKIVNGNTMYTLSVQIPSSHRDEVNSDLFFKNFKLAQEAPPESILKNTPAKLFNDLKSNDSITFENAVNSLRLVRFETQHLPMLIEKALLEYPAVAEYEETVNEQLFRISGELYPIASPSLKEQVRALVEQNYAKPEKVIEEIRFAALGLLAKDTTQESYALIKKLLAERIPSKGNDYLLFNFLDRSMKFSHLLYPEVMLYFSDTAMGMGIASMTRMLIDSGMISPADVAIYKQDILKLARRQLKIELKQNDDEYVDYRIEDLLKLMGELKQGETDKMLTDFLKVKTVSTKEYAAIALLRNNKPVSVEVLKKIADDRSERANLYDELFKLNKDQLFPHEYSSQQQLGKSYIYRSLLEDDEDQTNSKAELVYIKQVESEYGKEKKRFFLFRVNFPAAEDTTGGQSESMSPDSYLGIAGPFELDTGKFGIESGKNISGVYFDDKFDGSMLDELFKKFKDRALKWNK